MRNKFVRGLLAGVAGFALAYALRGARLLRPLEWKSWDARVRIFADPSKAGRDIAVILIDQYSLDVFEKEQSISWPWPRQMYAALIDFLTRGGAKACFIDLDLSSSSTYGVEDDKNLAGAMARAGNVFLPVSLSAKGEDVKEVPAESLKRFSLSAEDWPSRAVFLAKSASLPAEALFTAVRGVGNVLFGAEEDIVFRSLPLVFRYKEQLLPSLPLAVADFVRGDAKAWDIPLDRSGRMILHYHGPSGTYKTYNAAAIINSQAMIEEGKGPQIKPEVFAGKIVLLGGSAAGLLDLRPTPLSPVSPGVEIHATAIDNLLRGDFFREPTPGIVLLFILFCGLVLGIGASYLKKIWHLGVFFALCLALPAAGAGAAYKAGFWLEFVAPATAALAAFIGASLLNYNVEGRKRRFIKNVFRHYLSPDVIERILESPDSLRLGGEQREITSFFSDVAGFTAISEGLSPADLVNLLNAYLSEMTDIILASGGTLDKYEGDAIIAFWNAPLDQPDHALRACRAALACQKRLAEMRPHLKEQYGQEMRMRIGLNSGPAVVGNMGSGRRFDYTAIGDTVNLAARLEGASKRYKVPVLVGEETYRRVKDVLASRKVDSIRVVGKKKPVEVYEIFGEQDKIDAAAADRLRLYAEALAVYEGRKFEHAAALFERIEDDPLSAIYAERCRILAQSPPPPEWDGVLDLKEK